MVVCIVVRLVFMSCSVMVSWFVLMCVVYLMSLNFSGFGEMCLCRVCDECVLFIWCV